MKKLKKQNEYLKLFTYTIILILTVNEKIEILNDKEIVATPSTFFFDLKSI